MNLNNIFLITDADGTLLTDDKRILGKDKAAIRELTESGGLFTIATGRGVSLAKTVADELNLKIPAVIFNGAAVYDFKRNCFLWQSTLPAKARNYIKLLMERFPLLGIEILRGDKVYVVRTNELEEEHIRLGCDEPIRCGFEDVPHDNWIKTLLVGNPHEIDRAIAFCDECDFTGIHLVRSAPIFYEMLPSGINKGTGFKKLLEIMEVDNRYVVAAGDFMNDLEMLQAADLGVAVANAEEVVKKEADLMVCDNNSGAMREIIQYLKKA
ncbi:MAG: HAD family hydrolase [Oscillospiraceae bacterium]|jgi:Cof subfamily protein (haloacid dehalogenase superfamily)|nr:HAD family hydrolase [Oscillospiraceae bacterium]